MVLSTSTLPVLPLSSLARVSAASWPPWVLFDEMEDSTIEASLSAVSTWTTLVPTLVRVWIGLNMATLSVGAISTPAGLLFTTELTIGVCASTENFGAPCWSRL